MVDLIDLYQFASEQGVDVDWVPMEQALSLSIPLPDGTCCIALNPWRLDMVEKEAVCLAHELGHCELGAFDNQWAACDVRRKHENRADKWAITHLIPEEALDEAVADGEVECPSCGTRYAMELTDDEDGEEEEDLEEEE